MLQKNLRWWEFEIESKNYKNKELGPKFKGKFRFTYNKNSLEIYNFYYLVEDCIFSLPTTKDWFEKKPSLFKKRKLFLDNINEKFKDKKQQLKRLKNHKYVKNELFHLNEDHLNFLNENSDKYFSTIKSIDGFIKGYNPSGEELYPNKAPIIISEEYEKKSSIFAKNFALFFKYYSAEDSNYKIELKNLGSKESEILKEDYFEEFEKITTQKNNRFSNLRDYVEKLNKDGSSNKDILKSMKREIICNIEKILSLEEIKEKIKLERSKVSNINIEDINIFKFSEENMLERAHIFSVSDIRALLVVNKDKGFNDEENQDILSWISDPNNLIALEPTIHSKFDAGHFTWNENGQIEVIKNMNNFRDLQDKLFNKMKSVSLTPERKKFFQKRNN